MTVSVNISTKIFICENIIVWHTYNKLSSYMSYTKNKNIFKITNPFKFIQI